MTTVKVLYIGHYREASGWGQAARNYILALDSVGVDVVPRPIYLQNSTVEIPTRLIELEQKSADGCDVCIQHVLPHFMEYNGYFKKNIGLFVLETDNINYTNWPPHINLMDEAWVPCKSMQRNKGVNDITVPCHVVPHTFDLTKYNKSYEPLDIPDCKNSFTFYFIGEFNRRKHISALIRAFHCEFSPGEPVNLVLKVSKFGLSENELTDEIKSMCNQIKSGLNLYNDMQDYKPEIIITRYISSEDIMRLHRSCKCFVSTSYGEAWNIPCFESMAMGNPVIATNVGGMSDYVVNYETGFLIDGTVEPLIGVDEALPGFGTARETWINIDIGKLMRKMRQVYANQQLYDRLSTNGKVRALDYSYEKVGNIMKELLYR